MRSRDGHGGSRRATRGNQPLTRAVGVTLGAGLLALPPGSTGAPLDFGFSVGLTAAGDSGAPLAFAANTTLQKAATFCLPPAAVTNAVNAGLCNALPRAPTGFAA